MKRHFPPHLELSAGPVGALDLALHAAASGDHNLLHLDESVAAAAGFERPVIHGMLTMAYVARLFSAQFGAGAVLRLATRFTGVALRGDVVHVVASLESVDEAGARYQVKAATDAGWEVAAGTVLVAHG